MINYFQKLKLATGGNMNQEKTKILSVNTDLTKTLQQGLPNLTIKEQYDTINILELTFCEGMKLISLTI